jgi:hypothetical protein
MRYFMVRRQWSQTDEDSIILRATSKEAIQKFYADQKNGPRYITVYPCGERMFELTESAGIVQVI